MIEKAYGVSVNIQREELVEGVRRQTLAEHARRAHRPTRHDRVEASGGEFFDAGQERQTFADAGAVHPDNASLRPRVCRKTAAFTYAHAILFTARQTEP